MLLREYTKEQLQGAISGPRAHYNVGGPEDCWPWAGVLDRNGYGRVFLPVENGRVFHLAHRIVFHLAYPDIDIECCRLKRSCATPSCGNPAHWKHLPGKAGMKTPEGKIRHKANVRRGETHTGSKLDWNIVSAMRARKLALGELYTSTQAAAEFGCSLEQATSVLSAKSWSEDKRPDEMWPHLAAGRKA